MALKKGKSTLVTDQGIFCCLQLLRMRLENPAMLLVDRTNVCSSQPFLGITEARGCMIYPLDICIDTLCPITPVCSNTNRNQTASESAAQQPQLWPFLSNGTSIARSNSSRRSVLGWLKCTASRADTDASDQQLTFDVVDKQRSKNGKAASNLQRFQSRIGTSIPSSNIINDGSSKYASSRMDGTSAVQRSNQSSVHARNSNVSTNNSASLTAGSRLVRNRQANKHGRQPYLGSKTASIPQESAGFGHAQSAHARALLGSPSPADPTISTPSPSTGTSSPPGLSPTSVWLQSVTNNTGNYVTSTISLTDNSLNADGLVAQGTMSGVTVTSSGGSSNTPVSTVDTFNGDASYVTSMQDLPYTLFVAGVLMTALVLAHAGESRSSSACRDVHLTCQREATCSRLF